MIKKTKNGFTMIELLIVIVILGILSAIGLGSFTAAQEKSRDSNRKSSLSGIATSLEVYYNDVGSYPLGSAGAIVGCGDGIDDVEACTPGSIWQDNNGTTYMVQMPDDPRNNSFYYISNNGTEYQLYARLENVNDGSVPLLAGSPGIYSNPGPAACGGSGCNYGVASSNTNLGNVVAN